MNSFDVKSESSNVKDEAKLSFRLVSGSRLLKISLSRETARARVVECPIEDTKEQAELRRARAKEVALDGAKLFQRSSLNLHSQFDDEFYFNDCTQPPRLAVLKCDPFVPCLSKIPACPTFSVFKKLSPRSMPPRRIRKRSHKKFTRG